MRRKTEVGEIQIAMAAAEGVALTVLKHLRNGEIHGAIACFAEEFTFKDQGIGLEFKDKKHLSECFWKTRELSPDYSWETDAIFVSGNCVTIEWTLQTPLTEPFYGDSPERFQSRSMVSLSFGRRTRSSPIGQTTTTDLTAQWFGCALRGMGRTLRRPAHQNMTSKRNEKDDENRRHNSTSPCELTKRWADASVYVARAGRYPVDCRNPGMARGSVRPHQRHPQTHRGVSLRFVPALC